MKIGLVLEGGGTRGNYTAGALEFFLEKELNFDLTVGTSAGSCAGIGFVSRQKGRLRRVTLDNVRDKRYAGVGCILRERSVFGMKFNFDTVPNELDPFDYEAFQANPCEFAAVTLDAETAELVYFTKDRIPNGDMSALRASSSLPVFSPPVEIEGRMYYDGGVTDPIPVRYALDWGCDRVVVILTQPEGYQKSAQKGKGLYRRVLRKYPRVVEALGHRHEIYNETLEFIRKLEAEGRAVVLRPSVDLGAKRFTRDLELLGRLFELGRTDAEAKLPQIRALLAGEAL